MNTRSESATGDGVHGVKGSLPLVDVLQVWSMNHFSGLVVVSAPGRVGHVYFLEGEIVHAEAGEAVGEQAVAEVLEWPGVGFEPFPNTTTLKRTITKRLSHLLLDAHRVLDERRRGAAQAAPPQVPAARERAAPSALDRVRAIPGVTQVVRFAADGRTAPGAGLGAEALAAKGLYLALNHAAAIGRAFGLGALVVGSVHGQRESFLVAHAHGNYLGVAVGEGGSVEAAAAQVRAMLTQPVPR